MTSERKYFYYKFFKPFGYCSQFTDESDTPGLARLLHLPKDVYPVGRLDKDSEGLLLLTNDNRFKQAMLSPEKRTEKIYLVQVEGKVTQEAVDQLIKGVVIRVAKKEHFVRAIRAHILNEAPDIPPRTPPIRFRLNIPDSWLEMVICEGKNRQVRRMTAAVGFPTLRLLRTRVGRIGLQPLAPGEWATFQP
jgi:23S rRNA pseudouridine2457 synthase